MINGYLTDKVITKYLLSGLNELNIRNTYTVTLTDDELRDFISVCEMYSQINKPVYILINTSIADGVTINYNFSINSILIVRRTEVGIVIFMNSSPIINGSSIPCLLTISLVTNSLIFNLVRIDSLN